MAEEDKEKTSSPIVEDRWLGAVAGNKLDGYNNSTYNWRLYMIPDDKDGGGYMNGALKADPENTVIIAQTGVTGIAIDNVSLNIVKGNSGAFVTNGSFTLIQPGAADLLDQIQLSKKVLGIKAGMFANVPIFLELSFKGYTEDLDDTDSEGKPVTIDGPWCWQCEIATIDVNITEEGSTYDFTIVIGSQNAYSDIFYTLPADTSMTGSTIAECIESLQETLTKYREDNYKEHAVQDEVEFDLSQLASVIKDDKIKYNSYENAEQINRLMNAQSQGIKTRKEYDKALEDNPESLDGGIKASGGVWRRDRIQIKEGTNFHRILTTLLVMNEDFLEQCQRKKGAMDDPNIDEDGFDLKQAFTKWYRINAYVEWLDYDHRRNTYAKKITYQPVIYDTADGDQIMSPAENNTTKEDVNVRIKEMNIKKAYHYLYTGLNDQILNADISYHAGQLLLGAPGGGMLGDASTNPNAPGSSARSGDPDGDKAQGAYAVANADVDGLSNQLATDPNLMQRVQDKLNLTEAEKKAIQEDEQKRKNLAEAIVFLNAQGSNPLGYKKSKASGTNPYVPVSPTDVVDDTYSPEPSGYLYSAEIISDTGGSETVIGELSGATALNTLKNSLNAKDDGESTSPRPGFSYAASIVSTSGNTSDGTAKATLFGYMFQNVNDVSILVDLNLKVRGDPWYLGEKPKDPTKGRNMTQRISDSGRATSLDAISYDGNDNYFLFTMQTPRVIDPDVDDEDNNTGYMSQQGTAYFISGVYQIMGVTANFNGGMFDLDLNAKKQTALDLSKYDLVNVDYNLDASQKDNITTEEWREQQRLSEQEAQQGDGG